MIAHNNEPLRIKTCEHTDSPDIAHLHATSWRQTYAGLVPQDYLDSLDIGVRRKMWGEILLSGKTADYPVLLASLNDSPVGFISFGKARDEEIKESGEIYAVYLLKDHWSKGIGHKLFMAAKNSLLNAGFSSCYLWVLDTNKDAIDSYIRWGGRVETDIRKDETIGGQPVSSVMIRFYF